MRCCLLLLSNPDLNLTIIYTMISAVIIARSGGISKSYLIKFEDSQQRSDAKILGLP
jgi:hypothetical protein